MKDARETSLLWIVPRMPWPPRCGASHANCELISSMAERGYRIHVFCISSQSAEIDLDQARRKLGVESLRVVRQSIFFRFRALRLISSFLLQLRKPYFPLTVIPFASASIQRSLRHSLKTIGPSYVIWDGLHPMAALQGLAAKACSQLFHIYRAHNIESMIWSSYGKSLPKILSKFFVSQVRKMDRFEKLCLGLSNAIAFVQEADQNWFNLNLPSEKKTRVVPISIVGHHDAINYQLERWKRNNSTCGTKQILSLVWIGGMNWWPNRQALIWFLRHVWNPLMLVRNNVKLTMIGQGTERLNSKLNDRVLGLGFRDNLDEVFRDSDALIVPIQSGGGIRVKALESLAHAVPCIGTSLGVLGVPQEGVYKCDSAEEWLQILSILTPQECQLKGLMGWRAVKRDFSREKSAQLMEDLMKASY